MNFAKSRMCAAVAATVAAFVVSSASAAIVATNNFESALDAAEFTTHDAGVSLTDISTITDYASDEPSVDAPAPFANYDYGSKYLAVDTDDAMLWRTFDSRSATTYFDSVVKFSPTAGDVEYPADSKFVVFLDAATSNLFVVSGTSAGDRTPVTNRLANVTVYPDTWRRLTVNAVPESSVFAFQVRVDGTLLETADATPVSTFYSLAPGASLSEVGLKGAGAIDDMVVRTTAPVLSGTVAATIDGEDFATLAAATAAAQSGDTILLQADSSAAVSLPTGVTFNTNGRTYSGSVTAASGNGYEVVQNAGVYTIVDNTASTWQGSASGADWTVGSNWSTGRVPSQYTAVTIPATEVEGGWLIYLGGNAQAKSIALLGDATFQRASTFTDWGNVVVQQGITTGSTPSTLTLNSASIFAGSSVNVTIDCNILFKTGYVGKPSRFTSKSTGGFVVNGAVSGTDTLNCMKATTFNGSVSLPDGVSVYCESLPTFGDDASLVGSGTLTVNGDSLPGTKLSALLGDSTKWTGVYSITNMNRTGNNVWWFGQCGNPASTVRLGNVSTVLKNSAYTDGSHNVKVDIAGGFTVTGNYSSDNNWVFSNKLSGDGTITVDTGNGSKPGNKSFVFTGDCSEFRGGVAFGSSAAGTRVVFGTTTRDYVNKSIVVGSNASVSLGAVCSASGGFFIDGEATLVASAATLTGTVCGSGVIVANAKPSSTPTLVASGWTGTYVIAWPEPSDAKPIWILDNYGIAGSTVRVRTEITKGYFKKSNTDNVSPEFAPAVYFENSVKVNDGYTYANNGGTTKFSKLGMAAGKLYRTRGGSGFSLNNSAYYEFTVLEDFEGTIVAGGVDKIEFGTIVLDAAPSANSCVVKVNRNGSSVIDGLASVQVKVGGAAAVTMPMVYTSMSGISGLYKAVAKIGADKYYATFQDALNARTAAGGSGDIIALDASAPLPDGYRIVDGKLVRKPAGAIINIF